MDAAAISGMLAGYGIAMPVGAIAIFLIRLGATACLCIGAAAGLGAASVDGGYALATVVGGRGFAGQVHAVAAQLHPTAGVLLAAVAAWMGLAALRRYRASGAVPGVALRLRTPLRAYVMLAGLTLLNPLTAVYWAALVLGQQTSSIGFTPAQAGVFVLAVLAASASWQLVLVGGGKVIGGVVGSRRGMLAISLASSLLIAVLAGQILRS
jgi:arginine exporter protein ArgO